MAPLSVCAWRSALALALSITLPATAVVYPSTALAQPADAKAALADADKAAKAKDWTTAASLFDAANKAQPSSAALDGLANALYQGNRLGEAHVAYTEWLATYSAKAPAGKKRIAENRLKEIAEKTGAVTISANEAGAEVLVDDKPVGTTPLSAPVRLTAGPHRIRITKDGFLPFDQAPNVSAGSAMTVQATLAPASSKGKLSVKEKSGLGVRIFVDGVDMGPAPWIGEVEAGEHEVSARATGFGTEPQKVTVERGKTMEVELVASPQSASVRIATSDGKGLIYVDGQLVSEGNFIGELSAGTHKLKITREGYDPVEEDLVVKNKEPLARTVTLKLSSTITTGEVVEETERLEGLYGGFGLLGLLTPGGTDSSIEKECDAKTATSTLRTCETPGGLGGGLGAFFGYHWDPVAMELYIAGSYDQRRLKRDYDAASTDPGLGPDPARLEEFNLRRAGGMGLARVRFTAQSQLLRFGLTMGAGVSYRAMFLERLTTAKDNPAVRDIFVADSVSYVAPVIAVEPSIMYRVTRAAAISLGVQVLLETPSSFLNDRETPKTLREQKPHSLGIRTLSTPSYELASNVQVFVGPVLGMMFGP